MISLRGRGLKEVKRALIFGKQFEPETGTSCSCWTLSSFSSRFGRRYISRKHKATMSKVKDGHYPPVITISVDGNISSGKSTLVDRLKAVFPSDFNFQVDLIPEPLEKWTDLKGHNLLGMFYEDVKRHNFMFQHYVQLTRLIESVKKPPQEQEIGDGERKGIVRIMERSLQNNRYCFTELARREGNLEPEEFAVLSAWHEWMEANFKLTMDLIIYLRTSPETVYSRMQRRGRAEESSVPIDYLRKLHETYEDWLVRGKSGSVVQFKERSKVITSEVIMPSVSSKQRVLVIDANQGKDEVAMECSNFLRRFMEDSGFK